jgi:hypothetical protein
MKLCQILDMLKVTPLGYDIQNICSSVHISEEPAASVLHFTTLHVVTFNKTVIYIVTAMRFHKV